MSDVVIRAEGLGKRYRIGGRGGGYTALRDVLAERVRGLVASVRGGGRGRDATADATFWALREVGFDIRRGEVVGLIGRNGAGKSTLLKLLSRITEPTEGRVTIRGRVASLLEVGTGFHPELTGRENVYLNGAVLGMGRAEIRRKFDEIVAFAETERFIDTPVKRYSSGMYIRLAFAVAAHLEAEILVIDEVLAVGDAEFQARCLGKMGEVARDGRTVLFVSHNLSAVRALCAKGILLEKGRVAFLGSVSDALSAYSLPMSSAASLVRTHAPRSLPAIRTFELVNAALNFGEDLRIELVVESDRSLSAAVEFEIRREDLSPIIYASTSPMYGNEFLLEPGSNRLEIKLGPLPLARGAYLIQIWLIKPWVQDYDHPEEWLRFEIVRSDPGNSGFDFLSSYQRGNISVPVAARIVT